MENSAVFGGVVDLRRSCWDLTNEESDSSEQIYHAVPLD